MDCKNHLKHIKHKKKLENHYHLLFQDQHFQVVDILHNIGKEIMKHLIHSYIYLLDPLCNLIFLVFQW